MDGEGALRRWIAGIGRRLGPNATMWALLAMGAALTVGFSWAAG